MNKILLLCAAAVLVSGCLWGGEDIPREADIIAQDVDIKSSYFPNPGSGETAVISASFYLRNTGVADAVDTVVKLRGFYTLDSGFNQTFEEKENVGLVSGIAGKEVEVKHRLPSNAVAHKAEVYVSFKHGHCKSREPGCLGEIKVAETSHDSRKHNLYRKCPTCLGEEYEPSI